MLRNPLDRGFYGSKLTQPRFIFNYIRSHRADLDNVATVLELALNYVK